MIVFTVRLMLKEAIVENTKLLDKIKKDHIVGFTVVKTAAMVKLVAGIRKIRMLRNAISNIPETDMREFLREFI